jgi:hypothetical protein
MTADYDDEPITLEEYIEIKEDYDKVIESVHKAQELVEKNDMDEALGTLIEIKTDCPICQSEIDDAKQKIQVVNELCNIEKASSDQKCQKMTNFILDNLTEFVGNINEALRELKNEAHDDGQEETES